MVIMRILIISIIFSSLLGCDSSNQVAFDSGSKFHDDEMQKLYVEQLQKDGVPHKVLPDGSVAYSSRDEKIIKEGKMNFLHDSFEPHVCYFDKNREKRFLDALKAANIKYEIKEKPLGMCVTWAKMDDERVNQIRNEQFKSAVWFGSLDSEQNFLKKLEEEGIAYSIFEEDGHRKIYWSKEDDIKARAIFHEPSNSIPCKDSQEKLAEEKIYSDGSKSTVGTDFLQVPFEPHTCYFDEEKQRQFIDSLEKENIKYEIKTTKLGLAKCVIWPNQDDYRVKQITKRMFNPSGWFSDLEKEKNFLEKMEEARIGYTMYEEEGNRKISWFREDEGKVDKVYENLAR